MYADVSHNLARGQAKQRQARNSQVNQAQGRPYPVSSPQLPLPQIGVPNLISNKPQIPNENSIRRGSQGTYVKETGPMSELPAATTGIISGSTSEGNPEGESLREQLRMLQDGKGRFREYRALKG
jgi:hypothetical protein